MSALIPDTLLAHSQTLQDCHPGRVYVRLNCADHGMDFATAFRLWRDLGKALEMAAGWEPQDGKTNG